MKSSRKCALVARRVHFYAFCLRVRVRVRVRARVSLSVRAIIVSMTVRYENASVRG